MSAPYSTKASPDGSKVAIFIPAEDHSDLWRALVNIIDANPTLPLMRTDRGLKLKKLARAMQHTPRGRS